MIGVRAIACLGSGLLLASIVSAQPPAAPPRFPEGPGRAALLKSCSECHGAESAIAQFKTRDEWRKTLDEMAANGAEATDEEWSQILEYLDKHFSLILVNKAAASELAKTLDVSGELGDAIVRYRDEHGRFGTIEDLKRVPGLDAAKIDARKERFVF
jgi:competence protein ComEA